MPSAPPSHTQLPTCQHSLAALPSESLQNPTSFHLCFCHHGPAIIVISLDQNSHLCPHPPWFVPPWKSGPATPCSEPLRAPTSPQVKSPRSSHSPQGPATPPSPPYPHQLLLSSSCTLLQAQGLPHHSSMTPGPSTPQGLCTGCALYWDHASPQLPLAASFSLHKPHLLTFYLPP